MNLQEESQLVAQAKKNPDAFGALFDHYHPKILAYLIHRTGNVALAQDLSSETFFKALSKLWQFQFRSISFSAWLYRIAGNELNMHYRGKRPVSLDALMENAGFDAKDSSDLVEELKEAEEKLSRQKDFLEIRKKLENLPFIYQTVITLRYLEEKEIPEIAEIVGKRQGTVRSILSRGLQKLRDMQQI